MLIRGEVLAIEQLGQAEHAVHRRADLVAHVRQELALGPGGGLGGRFAGLQLGGAAADLRFQAVIEVGQGLPAADQGGRQAAQGLGQVMEFRGVGVQGRHQVLLAGLDPPGEGHQFAHGPGESPGTPPGQGAEDQHRRQGQQDHVRAQGAHLRQGNGLGLTDSDPPAQGLVRQHLRHRGQGTQVGGVAVPGDGDEGLVHRQAGRYRRRGAGGFGVDDLALAVDQEDLHPTGLVGGQDLDDRRGPVPVGMGPQDAAQLALRVPHRGGEVDEADGALAGGLGQQLAQ